MSKFFSCFFPYSKKVHHYKDDVKNTGFLQNDSNSSFCEMSYHHVDAVSMKFLRKKIMKLERENNALVEIMIYQHENYKKSSKLFQNEILNNSNYYTDTEKHYDDNTYVYIDHS